VRGGREQGETKKTPVNVVDEERERRERGRERERERKRE